MGTGINFSPSPYRLGKNPYPQSPSSSPSPYKLLNYINIFILCASLSLILSCLLCEFFQTSTSLCPAPSGPGPYSPALCSPLPLPVRVVESACASCRFTTLSVSLSFALIDCHLSCSPTGCRQPTCPRPPLPFLLLNHLWVCRSRSQPLTITSHRLTASCTVTGSRHTLPPVSSRTPGSLFEIHLATI